jgi:tRNA threonylcarbamoyladenosine biosynthesis protein TsaE
MRQIVESFSEQDTFQVGYRMGTECKRGDIVLLNGDLGVGKTVFTKGFGEGLGVKDTINSPTFTIMQIYETGRLPLYHFDVYRIGDLEEMEEIGYEDYFYGDGVCLIEWAELIQELLPDKVVKVTIEKELEKGFEYRKISVDKS